MTGTSDCNCGSVFFSMLVSKSLTFLDTESFLNTDFKCMITCRPGWVCSRSNSAGSYHGRNGMELAFCLRQDDKAIVLLVATGWLYHADSPLAEQEGDWSSVADCFPTVHATRHILTDVGGEDLSTQSCPWIGNSPCACSYLPDAVPSRLFETLCLKGEMELWRAMAEVYQSQ